MQTLEQRQAADARVQRFSGRILWLIVIAGATATLLFTQTIVQVAFLQTADPAIQAIKIDFRVFWAAGRLALDGEPLAAFDLARLSAVHNVATDAWMPWLYPPAYLVLMMPFGAMPFSYGLLVFTLLSVGLIGLSVRSFIAGSAPVWLAMTLAPAYVPTLILGQNNLIWVAGLIAALAALRDGRWIWAGVFIGCLTLKPQLGLLIPIALLAMGLWRTIGAAVVTALVLAVVPTFIFGPEYWTLFATGLSEQGSGMLRSLDNLFLLVNPIYVFTLLGLSAKVALGLQWGIVAVSAVIVGLLWRSRDIGFDAKVAGLLIAMLLSAPYLWYYEVAIMPIIGLFLVRAGILGQALPHLVLLLCLWLGAFLAAANAVFEVTNGRYVSAVLITPVLVISLVTVLRHYTNATRQPAARTA
jgi:arabinofuranan 3-O-arabinosyltransferase